MGPGSHGTTATFKALGDARGGFASLRICRPDMGSEDYNISVSRTGFKVLELKGVGFEDERIFRRNSPSSALPKTRRCTSPASGFIRPWEAAWQLDLLLAGGDVQAKTFALLGAVPLRMDLTEAIAMIKAGTLDAQENPFANTVTYGVHKFHKFHTITNHFYISRPVFLHRAAFEAWPQRLQDAMQEAVTAAVLWQREHAVLEDAQSRAAIEGAGC